MVKKLFDLYSECRKQLLTVEDKDAASFIARNIVCSAASVTHEQFLANREKYVDDPVCDAAESMTQRALGGEPLAYILGQWEFYGLKLFVDHNVLIPRDDTCAVTDLAVKKGLFLGQNPRILDLCTGSGCIGLAIASRVKDARVTLGDISKDALAVAKKNIAANHLGGRVSCHQVDALGKPGAFLGKFDMIVSNPPYITTAEMEQLPESVKAFEPHLALHGGDDGLIFYRAIIENYTGALKPGGYICFEFGMVQGDDICQLLQANGYIILERTRDYNDRERAVLAQYGREEV